MAQLGQRMKSGEAPTRAMTREFNAAVRSATALKDKAQQQGQQLQTLRTRLSAAGVSATALSTHERRLRTDIASTNTALARQETQLKATADRMRRLADAKGQYDKTMALRGQLSGSGLAMTAAGGGALYGGARLLAPGVEFDTTMSKVQALTRLDKNSPQLAALREQARQLGADTMFSATDAARGQAFLAMAGFTPQSIRAAMPGLLDMAKADDMDLGVTADIASNILSGLNLKADQMTRVADVMVGTFTRSNTNIAMLGDTMKYVAPVAASVHQELETVAAMAGKLGDAGIQGGMAGTALRSVLNRLSAPPKAAADALDQLGISAKNAEGNMRPMPEILSELYEKTKDLGTADRAGLLKGIAGEEAVSALQVLVRQAGTGELQQFIATLRQTQGEASRTAKIMGDNLTGELDELSSAWDDVRIQMLDGQNSGLRELIRHLTGVVGAIGSWMKENPKLTATLIKFAAAGAIVVATLGAVTLSAAAVLGPIAVVRYSLAFLGVKGGLLTVVLRGLGTAFMWVGRGLLFVGRALLMNPIGLAVTGIAASVYVIYRYWEPIKGFFVGIWDSVRATFAGGMSSIGAAIVNWSPLGLVYSGFAAMLNWLGFDLPTKFSEVGANILRGLVAGITGALGSAKEAITGAGGAVIGWFKEKLGIRSPSRVFAELGGFTMAGLAQGIAGGEDGPLKQIGGLAVRMARIGAGVAIGAASLPAMAFDGRPPLQGGAGGSAAGGGNHYEIHVHAAQGMDLQAIAQVVAAEIDRRDRAKASRARSSLHDYD